MNEKYGIESTKTLLSFAIDIYLHFRGKKQTKGLFNIMSINEWWQHSDPGIWVLVAFILFVGLAWRPLSRMVVQALDARSQQIRDELDEAVRLREEAQSILASYEKKQRESMAEAERIVEQTKADAKQLAENAEKELYATLEKRKKLAMNKIAQAETQAIQAVQQHVVDIAVSAAKVVIREEMDNQDSELIKLALSDVEQKLH